MFIKSGNNFLLARKEWERPDLNRRPIGYQPIALTAELRSLKVKFSSCFCFRKTEVESEALQPPHYYRRFRREAKGRVTEPFCREEITHPEYSLLSKK